MIDPAITISVLALAFTVASFWWMNWRHGRLHIAYPRTCHVAGGRNAVMVLSVPLVFFNDGPTPIIIEHMRIMLPEEQDNRPLYFMATINRLRDYNERAFSTPFPVAGQEALLRICEFQRNPGITFEARKYYFELQVKFYNQNAWKTMSRFALSVAAENVTNMNDYLLIWDLSPN